MPFQPAQIDKQLVLEPGSTFAKRYQIVEEIGRGGMGVVYRATEKLGSRTREIALKLIRADRAADTKAVESLLAEGALIQDIRHPNIVTVYNVGLADDRPFVAMQFVPGIALREWHRRRVIAGKEVSLGEASAIISSLLQGLQAAHAQGVIHRDLKPENIILTAEPTDQKTELQILDFGIARTPDASSGRSTGGAGTGGYMAPEQITYPESVQPSADLFSVSRIFYELLMDVLPLEHWQLPSDGRPDVPIAIDQLIEKGLKDRPGSRPQSVAEFDQALKTALQTLDSVAQRSRSFNRPGQESVVNKGAMFVTPRQDEQGKWHMPAMVDKDGQRTEWSWWGGYLKAYPMWVQIAVWGGAGLFILLLFGGA
ncbi:MAG: serine/threonine-protein kinase [Erythrobacter sp.]